MMEGIGGLELLAEIKKKSPDIPVIIMTGYGELDSAIEALRLGAADYLLKPCNNEELILRVGNCIDKVELQKNIRAKDGTWVQSVGERMICEVLDAASIHYRCH